MERAMDDIDIFSMELRALLKILAAIPVFCIEGTLSKIGMDHVCTFLNPLPRFMIELTF